MLGLQYMVSHCVKSAENTKLLFGSVVVETSVFETETWIPETEYEDRDH